MYGNHPGQKGYRIDRKLEQIRFGRIAQNGCVKVLAEFKFNKTLARCALWMASMWLNTTECIIHETAGGMPTGVAQHETTRGMPTGVAQHETPGGVPMGVAQHKTPRGMPTQ